jgi:hypothetical protein
MTMHIIISTDDTQHEATVSMIDKNKQGDNVSHTKVLKIGEKIDEYIFSGRYIKIEEN